MGKQYLAIVSWGFTLHHEEIKRVIQVIEEKRKLQGKESTAPEEGIDYEYLEDIFSITSEKFTVSIGLDYDDVEATVSIYYKKSLGSVERWGSDSGLCTKGLGVGGLDAKLDAIKADGSKELEEIKQQLMLREAGVVVEAECLLILEAN